MPRAAGGGSAGPRRPATWSPDRQRRRCAFREVGGAFLVPGYERSMTTLRAGVLGVMAALLSIGAACPAAAAPLRFGKPVWVDRQLAGGEPLVFADKAHHTLIYTSHEGTTHLYQPGLVSGATLEFGANYRNQ